MYSPFPASFSAFTARISQYLLTMCCFPGMELERARIEGFRFSEKEITQKVKLLFAPEVYLKNI